MTSRTLKTETLDLTFYRNLGCSALEGEGLKLGMEDEKGRPYTFVRS